MPESNPPGNLELLNHSGEWNTDAAVVFRNRVVASLGLPADASDDVVMLKAAEARDGRGVGRLSPDDSAMSIALKPITDALDLPAIVNVAGIVSTIQRNKDALTAAGDTLQRERQQISRVLNCGPDPHQILRATTEAARVATRAEEYSKALAGIGNIIGCYSGDPGTILDAATRLRERNAHLTSETSSAPATERGHHRAVKKALDSLLGDLDTALSMILKSGEQYSVSDKVKGLVDEVLHLRTVAGEVEELRRRNAALVDDARRQTETENGESLDAHECPLCEEDDDEVLLCDNCARCDSCHELYGCAATVGPVDRGALEDIASEIVTSEMFGGLRAVFAALLTAMVTDARDWSSARGDAWIFGIVCGWGEALAAVAKQHRWSPAVVARLSEMNAAVEAVMSNEETGDG